MRCLQISRAFKNPIQCERKIQSNYFGLEMEYESRWVSQGKEIWRKEMLPIEFIKVVCEKRDTKIERFLTGFYNIRSVALLVITVWWDEVGFCISVFPCNPYGSEWLQDINSQQKFISTESSSSSLLLACIVRWHFLCVHLRFVSVFGWFRKLFHGKNVKAHSGECEFVAWFVPFCCFSQWKWCKEVRSYFKNKAAIKN